MILSYRGVWYLLSIFVPFAGILVALFLYDRDDREVRMVGRNCLLFGFVVWVFLPLVAALIALAFFLIYMAGLFSDVMQPGD